MLGRALSVLALLLAASALAAEPPFPQDGDRFLLDVRGPVSDGRAPFSRIMGEPDRRAGWATRVTCGVVDLATGRETVTLKADGVAGRARGGWLGGTYPSRTSPTGTDGFTVLSQRGLDVTIRMPPPCASGRGQVSSGD